MLIHGDAAFAGEGRRAGNAEPEPAARLHRRRHAARRRQQPDRFHHVAAKARSSTYATDVAKMLQIPIFHVNGEDPEAVAQVVRLAMDFRHEFKRDVVIDMYGYRRRGHNEGDEPAFTQPLLYQAIEKRKPVREGYLEHLLKLGGVTAKKPTRSPTQRREHLEKELSQSHSDDYSRATAMPRGIWKGYLGGPEPKCQRSRNRRRRRTACRNCCETQTEVAGRISIRIRRSKRFLERRRRNGARRTAARLVGGRSAGLCQRCRGRISRSA